MVLLQSGALLKESDPDTGHQKVITSLAKSADGSHFITGSQDKSAKVCGGSTVSREEIL